MTMNNSRFKWKIRFAAMAIVFAAAIGLVVMLLWNWLMPTLFSLPELTYLQAVGLLILSKILLGGFSKGHRGGGHPYWRWKYKQKWEKMSDEEREQFKRKFRPDSDSESDS